MPALLLVHTDTFTQGKLSSWLDSKVQGPITSNGPTPVRTVGCTQYSIHTNAFRTEPPSPSNIWLDPLFPHSALLCFFHSKSPQILLHRTTDSAFCPSPKYSIIHTEEFMDGLPLHPKISHVEMITFLWQTCEEPGQDPPFLRLFPHLSPFPCVPLWFWRWAFYHTAQFIHWISG